MSGQSESNTGPAHRSVEIGVTIGIAIFALVVIVGSIQAGIGWGDEGPKAGFFPFYVGVSILISSAVNLIGVLQQSGNELFAEWSQLRRVMAVLIPTTIYVALIPWIGIYISSAVLIAAFMRWLGHYGWLHIVAIAVGLPLVIFVIFERWFLVPLPKGPIEAALGF
jgi:putative tricarboxylic transport membrane protein